MTVIWEHVSRREQDICSYGWLCLRTPRWVVQVGRRHRLACNRHRPKLTVNG